MWEFVLKSLLTLPVTLFAFPRGDLVRTLPIERGSP